MRHMPPKPDYDSAPKRLLLRAHESFLGLIAPGVTWRGELSPDLPATARRADFAWEVTLRDGRRGILHIELQTKPDATIGERVAEYLIRLWMREHVPMRSVVVFLRPTESISQSPFVIPWEDSDSQTTVFETLRLWEIPAERVLSMSDYAIWPLAGPWLARQ